MFANKLKAIILPAILVLLLFTASVLLLNTLIQKPAFQAYLLGRLSEATGYKLHARKIELSLWGGVGISAVDLYAASKPGTGKIVAPRIRILFDAGELVRGRIIPTKIFLLRPIIELDVTGRKTSGSRDTTLLIEMLIQSIVRLSSGSLKKAAIHIKNIPFSLEDIDLDISKVDDAIGKFHVNLRGNVLFQKEEAGFRLSGNIFCSEKGVDSPSADVSIETGSVPLSWIPWPACLPFKKGHAKAKIRLKGMLDGSLTAAGKIIADDFHFLLKNRKAIKDYSLPHLIMDFEASYYKKHIKISSCCIHSDDVSLEASLNFNFRERLTRYMALKVKSSVMPFKTFERIFPTPLVTSWLENRLFSIFTTGDVRLDVFSLQGSLERIGKLNLPENSDVLLMRMSLNDLELHETGAAMPFKKISGKFAIEKGDLVVSGVKAVFGNSEINKASLNIHRLFLDSPSFHVSLDGLFDLNDLLRQREMDAIPLSWQQQLKKVQSLTGNLKAGIQVGYEKGWGQPRILKGRFLFEECAITHEKLLLPITLEKADVFIDKEGESPFHAAGLWGNSGFQLSGIMIDSWEVVKADVAALVDMNEIEDFCYDPLQLPLRFSSYLPCNLSFKKDHDFWSWQGEMALDGLVMETTSFSMDPVGKADRLIFNMEIQPNDRILLKDLRCFMGESLFELKGHYDLTNDEYTLNVSTKNFLMENLGLRYRKADAPAKGAVTCQAEINARYRDPLKTSVTGELEAQDFAFALPGISSPVMDCDFLLNFSGKEVSLPFLNIQIGQSLIHVQGDFSGWDGLKGEARASSNNLDLSDFISEEAANLRFKDIKPVRNPFMKKSEICFTLDAAGGRWRKINCGPFRAECVFRSGDLFIERLRLQTEHGAISMKGHIKGEKEVEKQFSIFFKINEQPLKELYESVGFENKQLYPEGKVTLEGILYMEGREKEALISSLTGSSNVLLEKGKIKKSYVIFKILDFLSLQKFYKKRPQDLSKEGFYFESIKGHIFINRGVLETENIVMRGPVFNAVAKGTVDLAKKEIDFDIGAQPLGTVDSLISKIPIAGYILTGKEKSLLTYYFKVEGPLKKPAVRYVPLKKIGKNMIGFLTRLLLTPVRLFKDISGIAIDFEKKGFPVPVVP